MIRLGEIDKFLIDYLEQLVICGWIATLEPWILSDLDQSLQFVGGGRASL